MKHEIRHDIHIRGMVIERRLDTRTSLGVVV